MKLTRILVATLALLLMATSLWAQNPTGTLAGRITAEGAAVPGVVVTITSPAMQGDRTATTGDTGDFLFRFLPPGDYEIKTEIDGFAPITRQLKISAAQDAKLDLPLSVAAVTEELVIVGSAETISSSSQNATTNSKEFVEALPVDRTLTQAVLLTPGVNATGPNAAITIAGSQSYENLFLVNGVVVNENLRGTPFDLFIEDAIEETTTTTSGVSAEYGRFAGGVVNVITKSGGNDFSASLRTTFTNQDWEGDQAPVQGVTFTPIDKVNKRYEATFGGRLLRDRLWFFLAGRDFENLTAGTTAVTGIGFPIGRDQKRYEGKLTAAITDKHNVVGTYMEIEDTELGNFFGSILDLASVNNRATPQELMAFNYNGAFGKSFYLEAQYSDRKFTFEDSGSKFTDLVYGTLLVDRPSGRRWWSPTFCGVCLPEKRDNENILAKASYFLTTGDSSHDIVFGYDTFDDIRVSDNHQSGSDYRFLISNTIIQGTNLYPVIDNNTIIQFNPILSGSLGTSFKTNSIFVNDSWRFNDRLSFNLGLRYDQNDGVDSAGAKVVDDSKVSPRLSASYDLSGDGEWVINASLARYVTAIASSQANSASVGGTPATYQWDYRGPAINTGAGPYQTADVVIPQVFNWFNSVGGPANVSFLRGLSIPGGTLLIADALASPHTDEFAIGVVKRFGSKGFLRADYVKRESGDFYAQKIDRTTGDVLTPTGNRADLGFIVNEDNFLRREYDGLHSQIRWTFNDRIQVGANWTWSHARGNWDGETRASGPVPATILSYPEYFDRAWAWADGDLAIDRRHNARAWFIFNIFDTKYHDLTFSLLQNYFTGAPYGATGSVATQAAVTNPGYRNPPASVPYQYTAPDAFRSDDISATDVSLNYSFKWPVGGRDLEVFLQPEVLNVFNADGNSTNELTLIDKTVIDATTTGATSCPQGGANGGPGRCRTFNPFTTTPVEGVHWVKGPRFGQVVNRTAYQTPRTFRFSVGIRF
jgi:hypothetical protein